VAQALVAARRVHGWSGLYFGGALARASGVTEANVAGYLPYVDAYLVGTGIEHAFGALDPARVAGLHRTTMAHRPAA
jgi:hypothetical protein